MVWIRRAVAVTAHFVLVAAILLSSSLAIAAEEDAKARGQFDAVLKGINDRSFESIKGSIDRNGLTANIYSVREIHRDVKKAFENSYWQAIEEAFLASLPAANSDGSLSGEVVQFIFKEGAGHAVVRFRLPRYAYTYQVWEVQYSGRERLKVVDWFSASSGEKLSDTVGDELLIVMPSKAVARKLLSIPNPTDRQLFQATEILKATRDKRPRRFFEIYDDLDRALKEEQFIAKHAVQMALAAQGGITTPGRTLNASTAGKRYLEQTVAVFIDVFGRDADYALMVSNLLLATENYDDSYAELVRFYESYGVQEGATPARLSAVALAIGKHEDAEKYALAATLAEPALELGWWSLLRVRANTENFQGATEALSRLEDDFGHKLDAAKLRRDPFGGFMALSESQEYADWRASRQ